MSFESAESDYLEEDEPPEGYVTEERAEELFRAGLQAMRELIASSIEAGDDLGLAKIIRGEWKQSWGPDPGRPAEIVESCWNV